MPDTHRYTTAHSFRQALEERLNATARTIGTDAQVLRRRFAFDRFLARIFASGQPSWRLKGGYAIELTIQRARTTKDIDLVLFGTSGQGANRAQPEALRALLEQAAQLDLHDWLTFSIGSATMDIDAAPYGGARFPVDANMDGRRFIRFNVDIGIGDVLLEAPRFIEAYDWLAFAGIVPPRLTLVPAEQQFAEKLHAYTLVRSGAPNSRVKDLLDMALLIRNGAVDAQKTEQAILKTFERRGTHPVPSDLANPPDTWVRVFDRLAKECRLPMKIDEALSEVRTFLLPVLKPAG